VNFPLRKLRKNLPSKNGRNQDGRLVNIPSFRENIMLRVRSSN